MTFSISALTNNLSGGSARSIGGQIPQTATGSSGQSSNPFAKSDSKYVGLVNSDLSNLYYGPNGGTCNTICVA